MKKKFEKYPFVEKADEHVFELFSNAPEKKAYHNYLHSVAVTNHARRIGNGHELDEKSMEKVLVAALFHDAGHTVTDENHEQSSAELAEKFLLDNHWPAPDIAEVKGMILATKMPQSPKTHLERIMCDADLAGLGTGNYFNNSKLLYLEYGPKMNAEKTMTEWIADEIKFLSTHRYHTAWAELEYGPGKNDNIVELQKLLRNENRKASVDKEKKARKKEQIVQKEKKDQRPDRGIETMFRTTLRNHVNLSAIADNKANIMLSINALMISIIATALAPNFRDNPALIIPSGIMLLVCLMTIVFAVIATRPKVTSGTFTREDIKQKKSNLLFFGNFYNMELDEFTWGMTEMMKDREFLYGTMMKDFYYLGVVLAKKYNALRICYGIFMYGMIISVMAFIGSFIAFNYM